MPSWVKFWKASVKMQQKGTQLTCAGNITTSSSPPSPRLGTWFQPQVATLYKAKRAASGLCPWDRRGVHELGAMQPGFSGTEPACPIAPGRLLSSLLLELGTGGQSTRSAEGPLALPPSHQLTLHILRTQHQVDEADEVYLEVGAAVPDKHQQADIITEHDSCMEHRLRPWVLGTSCPLPAT